MNETDVLSQSTATIGFLNQKTHKKIIFNLKVKEKGLEMATSSQQPAPTRFELELEFVSLLANPIYLAHLAATKRLQEPEFVAYLRYLHAYWRQPEYARYLRYLGPTLRALEMLQEESFRAAILRPEVAGAWAASVVKGGREGAGSEVVAAEER